MMQMRKALFLPFRPAIGFAAPTANAAGIDRGRAPGKDAALVCPGRSSWEAALTHSDVSGAQALRRDRNEVNPARQARETPI